MSDESPSSSSTSNTELDSTRRPKRPRLAHSSSPIAAMVGTSGDDHAPTPAVSSDEEDVNVTQQSDTTECTTNGNGGDGAQASAGPFDVHEAPAEIDLATLHQEELEECDTISISSAPGDLDMDRSDMSLAVFSDNSINSAGGSPSSLPSLTSSVETIPDCLNQTMRHLTGSLSLGSLVGDIQVPEVTSGDTTTTSESTLSSARRSPRGDGPAPAPKENN